MADTTTVARPYAKAAFSFAQSHNDINTWTDFLKRLSIFLQDEKLITFLKNPQITAEQAFSLLTELSDQRKTTEHQQNFLHLLADNHRLLFLPEIYALFEEYVAEYNKQIEVNVTTVFPMSELLQDKLCKALEKRLERKVSLQFQLNEELIGGAVIRAGDLVIDGSIRNKLDKLNDIMTN